MNHRNFSGITYRAFGPVLRMDRCHHKQGCMQLYRHLTSKWVRRRYSNKKESLILHLPEQSSFLELILFGQLLGQSHQLSQHQQQRQLKGQTTSIHR